MMRQPDLHSRSGVQGEREAALRAHQSPGALEQAHPARAKAHERSPGAALFDGGMLGLFGHHLQFPVEIVGHDGCEKPGLVGGAGRESGAASVSVATDRRPPWAARSAGLVRDTRMDATGRDGSGIAVGVARTTPAGR